MKIMKGSVIASSLMHIGILGVAIFGLPVSDRYQAPPIDSLPVDLVSVEEFTRLQQGERSAPRDVPAARAEPENPREVVEEKPVEKPSERQVESQPAPPQRSQPPVQQAEAKPEPKPAEPEPQPQLKPEPEPEPVVEGPREPEFRPVAAPPRRPERQRETQVAESRPEPRPQQTQQETQSRLDTQRVAALLNRTPETPQGPQDTTNTAQQAGFGLDRGTDDRLSIDDIAFLRQQIGRCWNPPVGVENARDLTVDIIIELTPNGNVIGVPRVTRAPSTQLGQIAAESARRAVELCQPYALPPEKYDQWRAIELSFDPRFMFGG